MNFRVGKIYLVVCVAAIGYMNTSQSNPGFFVESLPKGARITIPQPATTIVPVGMQVFVGATDRGQAIKLTPMYKTKNKQLIKIDLKQSISGTKQLSYDLRRTRPLVYSFDGLETVRVASEYTGAGDHLDGKTLLKIESNRPIQISH